MPAPRPPGVTTRCGPSTSGDSLISHRSCEPPNSLRMFSCHTDRAVGLQARQIAVLGEHVQTIAIDGRRAARPGALIGQHPGFDRAERLRPDFLAVGSIERDDEAAGGRALLGGRRGRRPPPSSRSRSRDCSPSRGRGDRRWATPSGARSPLRCAPDPDPSLYGFYEGVPTYATWAGNNIVVTTTTGAGEEKRTFSMGGGVQACNRDA